MIIYLCNLSGSLSKPLQVLYLELGLFSNRILPENCPILTLSYKHVLFYWIPFAMWAKLALHHLIITLTHSYGADLSSQWWSVFLEVNNENRALPVEVFLSTTFQNECFRIALLKFCNINHLWNQLEKSLA